MEHCYGCTDLSDIWEVSASIAMFEFIYLVYWSLWLGIYAWDQYLDRIKLRKYKNDNYLAALSSLYLMIKFEICLDFKVIYNKNSTAIIEN